MASPVGLICGRTLTVIVFEKFNQFVSVGFQVHASPSPYLAIESIYHLKIPSVKDDHPFQREVMALQQTIYALLTAICCQIVTPHIFFFFGMGDSPASARVKFLFLLAGASFRRAFALGTESNFSCMDSNVS